MFRAASFMFLERGEDMIQKNVCGLSFELQADFDFGFLEEYGRVFRVFDQQDSGNICFGVDDGAKKYFVKLAGARPARSKTEPEQAVARLKSTISLYEALAHPLLLNVLEHRQVPGGYISSPSGSMAPVWAKCTARHSDFLRCQKPRS